MQIRLAISIAFLLPLTAVSLSAQAKDWPGPIKALQEHGIEVIGPF